MTGHTIPPDSVPRPALDRARSKLALVIESSRTEGRTRLPTLGALAEAAGVSRMTMWVAVREARETGSITASRGCPIRLVSAVGAAPPQAPAQGLPWERVAGSLRREILSGTPMPGQPMPSLKDLMRTHGVSYRTVRRAVETLVQEGLLQSYGRHVRVVDAPPARRARSEVVLIAFGSNGQIPLVTPRTHEHLRVLEHECSRMNVRLRIVTADQIFDVPTGRERLLAQLRRSRPLGLVLWRTVYMQQPFRELAALASQSGLPYTVLDESGDAESLLPPRRALLCRVFSMGTSTMAGRDLGRFLARHGHRRIAFVSRTSELDNFRQARFTGLRTALDDAGVPNGVELVALQDTPPDDTPISPHAVAGAVDRILADAATTALVGESDPVALLCLRHLQQRGIDVPGRISVAGFDDGMEAMLQRMTSYNFGGDDTTRAMLAFLLKPQRHMKSSRTPLAVELPGRVVERESTGPARHR